VLNEFLKEQKKCRTWKLLSAASEGMEVLTAQLKEQAAANPKRKRAGRSEQADRKNTSQQVADSTSAVADRGPRSTISGTARSRHAEAWRLFFRSELVADQKNQDVVSWLSSMAAFLRSLTVA